MSVKTNINRYILQRILYLEFENKKCPAKLTSFIKVRKLLRICLTFIILKLKTLNIIHMFILLIISPIII